MSSSVESLLVVGVEAEVFARLPPLLWRSAFDVATPANPELALHAISETRFSLIITAFPVAGVDYQSFLDEVRAFGSPCRASGLLAITKPEHLAEASAFIGRGLNKAVAEDVSDAHLGATVADLLHIAPRAAVRADVTLRVRIGMRERSIMTQSVNISRTGMMVRATGGMQVGERVSFAFTVNDPPGTVAGEADVARIADGGIGQPSGTGLRFVHLESDGIRILERFLVRMMLS